MKLEIKRGKSKICEKIAICLRMWENCSTFAALYPILASAAYKITERG